MPLSKEYRSAVEARICQVRPIRCKPMFGGAALYADDLIFAILDDDRIWFKADEQNRADYEGRGREQWRPMPQAPPMGYFELPAEVYADDAELSKWIERSLDVARRKAEKKSKKRSG